VIEVVLEKTDYVSLHRQMASVFKASVTDNFFEIPEAFGEGYAWAETLPYGITVLVCDARLKKDFSFVRLANERQFFSLQFNEISDAAANNTPHRIDHNHHKTHLSHSYVLLTQTLTQVTYTWPAGVRQRSVKFFFNREQLNQIVDTQTAERLLTQYFPPHFLKESPELIDVSYRPILDELMVKKIDHPLRINYILNRIMLLMEKFFERQILKNNHPVMRTRIRQSEMERLMVVEALLVKDYSQPPPTIEMLSKICAMSATKLKNDFKNLYGAPIYEYYQKNRMSKARALLLEGGHSIKEVGMMVGYSNLSHFAAGFKKEFGVLPSELLAKDGVLMYAL